jgi:small subunit ribosomal protein S18
MARKKSSGSSSNNRSDRKAKDAGKKVRKKVCIFCKDHVDWVDYKDVSLLRRFMSDRAKIRARRVTGNCAQHQRDVAVAIKTARELALLPYATRVTSSRGGGGRGRRDRDDRGDRGDRGDRSDRPPREEAASTPPGADDGESAAPAEEEVA